MQAEAVNLVHVYSFAWKQKLSNKVCMADEWVEKKKEKKRKPCRRKKEVSS